MSSGLLVKLRPTTPWRTGSDTGARDRVEPLYHSDSVYSAVTSAMAALGQLADWLEATAGNPAGSPVRFTSFYPYCNGRRYVVPPRNLWPPPPSAKVRWQGARFVPVEVVESLLRGKAPDDDRWSVDGVSGCLVPAGAKGPFRQSVRSQAAVDRITGRTEVHSTACLEFVPGSGLWLAVEFTSPEARERWQSGIEAAFRYLADTGFGGHRSGGWGRASQPEFAAAELPAAILEVELPRPPEQPVAEPVPERAPETAWWLLSLFAPAESDAVNWRRGAYSMLARGGRVESAAGWGQPKKSAKMIEEGSVLLAGPALCGTALNVAPEGFPHPVFRSGFALAIRVPWRSPYGESGRAPKLARSEAASVPEAPPVPEAPTEPAAAAGLEVTAEVEEVPVAQEPFEAPAAEAEAAELPEPPVVPEASGASEPATGPAVATEATEAPELQESSPVPEASVVPDAATIAGAVESPEPVGPSTLTESAADIEAPAEQACEAPEPAPPAAGLEVQPAPSDPSSSPAPVDERSGDERAPQEDA